MNTSIERVDAMIAQSDAIYDEIDRIEHGEPRYRTMLRVGVNAVARALKEGATLSEAGYAALEVVERPHGKTGPLDKLADAYGDVTRATLDRNFQLETDARHAIHLGKMALPYAQDLYPNLDAGEIFAYAVNHDIVEVHGGDTPSLGLSEEGRRLKDAKEAASLRMLWEEYGADYPQFMRMIEDYEHRKDAPARFVKGKDKLDAGYTHFANDGYQLLHYYNYRSEGAFRQAIDDGTAAMLPYCEEFPTILEDRESMTNRIVEVTYKKAA